MTPEERHARLEQIEVREVWGIALRERLAQAPSFAAFEGYDTIAVLADVLRLHGADRARIAEARPRVAVEGTCGLRGPHGLVLERRRRAVRTPGCRIRSCADGFVLLVVSRCMARSRVVSGRFLSLPTASLRHGGLVATGAALVVHVALPQETQARSVAGRRNPQGQRLR